MPISKENRKLYPKDWKRIATEIKEAANWTCVECSRPCRRPGESWDLFKYRLAKKNKALYLECCEKPTRFVLTVSHVDHNPSNCASTNLRSLCSVCHLRYDAKHHAATRAKNITKRTKVKPKRTISK